MTKALSLKMEDTIYAETESLLKKLDISRNAYINHAIRTMNQIVRRRRLKQQLKWESAQTAEQSLAMAREFADLADGIPGLD